MTAQRRRPKRWILARCAVVAVATLVLVPPLVTTGTAAEDGGFTCAGVPGLHFPDRPFGTRSRPAALRGVHLIDDVAVVLTYGSIHDVHEGHFFDTETILGHLAGIVDPTAYDFVLLFSVGQVDGWIHSGARALPAAAANIGLPNAWYGTPSRFPAWPRLRSVPHMNSVDLLARDGGLPGYASTLTAFHEIGHYWGVFWANESPGPRGWDRAMPVAWLASASAHWSWNWVEPGLPGLMYSGATSDRFNGFDLYAMGLMSHSELASHGVSHAVYECSNDYCAPGAVHTVRVDDLIHSLRLQSGPGDLWGVGRRDPELDDWVRDLRALIVVVKGAAEQLEPHQIELVRKLALEIPPGWHAATWGRSRMSARVVLPGQSVPGGTAVDQAQTQADYGFWFDRRNPRWQEFVPTFDNMSGAEILVSKAGEPGGNISVRVESGRGAILGQAVVPTGILPSQGWVAVEFSPPLRLVPGERHRLVVATSLDSLSPQNRCFWLGARVSPYCPSCQADVTPAWPTYGYAFRTLGHP